MKALENNVNPICVKQILVALDSSKDSLTAFKIALELASIYGANIKGVFIEDTNLINLAELPFHQEISQYTAQVREITSEGISRSIHLQSRRVIRYFYQMVSLNELDGDFTVLHGDVIRTLENECKTCDLIVMGKLGTKPAGRNKLGSTTKALVKAQSKPLLLVEEQNQLDPFVVVFDPAPLGMTCLETAADIMKEDELLVIFYPKSSENPDIKEFLRQWAKKKNINISLQAFDPHKADRLLYEISRLTRGLLILAKTYSFMKSAFLTDCLNKISLPVLLLCDPEII